MVHPPQKHKKVLQYLLLIKKNLKKCNYFDLLCNFA